MSSTGVVAFLTRSLKGLAGGFARHLLSSIIALFAGFALMGSPAGVAFAVTEPSPNAGNPVGTGENPQVTGRTVFVSNGSAPTVTDRRYYPDSEYHVRRATRGNLVVIGAPGLGWGDVNFADRSVAALRERAAMGGVGRLGADSAGRVGACVSARWLVFGAGGNLDLRGCPELGEPEITGGGDWIIPGFQQVVSGLSASARTRIGLLAGFYDDYGVPLRFIGSGAAWVGADSQGRLRGDYVAAPEGDAQLAATVAGAAAEFPVTVVDAAVAEGADGTSLARRVSTILAELPEDTQVMVLSVGPGMLLDETESLGTGILNAGYSYGIVSVSDVAQQVITASGFPRLDAVSGSAFTIDTGGLGPGMAVARGMAGSPAALTDLRVRLQRLSDLDDSSHTVGSAESLGTALLVLVVAGLLAGLWLLARRRLVFARVVRAVVAALCAGAVLGMLVLGCLPGARASPQAATWGSSTLAGETASADGPVVLVVTSGLRWQTAAYTASDALAERAAGAVVFNTLPATAKGAACPQDAWLTIGSGRALQVGSVAGADLCAQLPEVADISVGKPVAMWEYYRSLEAATFSTRALGSMGDALREAGVSAAGIGPGAALVLADSDGIPVGPLHELPESDTDLVELLERTLAENRFTVIDASVLDSSSDTFRLSAAANREERIVRQALNSQDFEYPEEKHLAVSAVRAMLGSSDTDSPHGDTDVVSRYPQLFPLVAFPQPGIVGATVSSNSDNAVTQAQSLNRVLAAIPDNARVIALSSGDSGNVPYLQFGLVSDPAAGGRERVSGTSIGRSASVQQDGKIKLADVSATITDWLGLSSLRYASGALIEPAGEPMSLSDAYGQLTDDAVRSGVIRSARNYLFNGLIYTVIVLAAATALLFSAPVARRMRFSGFGESSDFSGVARSGLRFVALTVSAVPAGSFIASLFPWWRADNPPLAVHGSALLLAGLLAVALLFTAPIRRRPLLPFVLVAGFTAVLLAADALSGSRVLLDAPLGFNTLAGARFHGVGNESFTLMATGTLVFTGYFGYRLVAVGFRWAMWLLVLGVGAAVTLIDGLPAFGADFGGPLALVPGVLVLALLLGGIRISWVKALAIVFATVTVVVVGAIGDWLRPSQSRTHLGRFVQSIIDGDLFSVLWRKLSVNLSALTWSNYRWVVLAAILFLLIMCLPLLRRIPAASGGFSAAWERTWGWLGRGSLHTAVPELRPILISWTVMEVLAAGLNDSGILLPGLALIMLLPGVISALAALPGVGSAAAHRS